jgi:hypothetical protein
MNNLHFFLSCFAIFFPSKKLGFGFGFGSNFIKKTRSMVSGFDPVLSKVETQIQFPK